MKNNEVCQWIKEGGGRKKILIAVNQPITARQLSSKTGIPVNSCSYLIGKLSFKGLLICLNPSAVKSRLYWLTKFGIRCRKQLHHDLILPYKEYAMPDVDWHLYGWVNFNHRAAIIKTLTAPMQPSEIKRFLRIHRSGVKISANNIRDIIKLFLARNIVRPMKIKKKAHPRYELTDIGIKLRQLLIQADFAL